MTRQPRTLANNVHGLHTHDGWVNGHGRQCVYAGTLQGITFTDAKDPGYTQWHKEAFGCHCAVIRKDQS